MLPRKGVVAVLLTLVAASCGMRGGSSQTIIDGLSAAPGVGGSATASGAHLTASAPGITPTTITVGTVQDISGPVPGLFQTALEGVKAWAAYQNSRGGIDGRRVVVDANDSGLDPQKFQQAVTRACTSDFALVGDMSAVDDAGAVPGQQCGIPDIADNPTTSKAAAASNVFAAEPSMPNEYPDGWFRWVKKNYPSAIKTAAIMWPGVATTELTGQRLRDTAESVGFDFVYQDTTSPVEANFLPYVQTMKSKGVEYFAWQADYQSMARILQSMQQLNWHPQVVDSTATAYNDQFLKAAGSAANGIFLSLNIGLFSESGDNPAIKSYLSWLDKAVPGHAPPDIFGVYSWAAGVMLAQAMTAAGPNPTRSQVITAIKSIHNFTGGGIMAPMDPGGHKSSGCFEVVTVKNGAFVRVYPTKPDTYDCTLGSLYTDPKIPPASLSG